MCSIHHRDGHLGNVSFDPYHYLLHFVDCLTIEDDVDYNTFYCDTCDLRKA